jgi:hypothetical protein
MGTAGEHDALVSPFRQEEAEEEGPSGSGSPVRARILWPALGFPAVIAPRDASKRGTAPADATRCIHVLLLSNRAKLTRDDVAHHLRFVPWDARERRHIKDGEPGTFRAGEIAVRADSKATPISLASPKDRLASLVGFGGGTGEKSTIVAALAKRVREFYRSDPNLPAGSRLPHLYEIRVSEDASGRLADGRYQLFWNNAAPGENAPSDELRLLLDQFARPRREEENPDLFAERGAWLLQEYEYEYGAYHPPYQSALAIRKPRTEILHPLFVRRTPPEPLRIGHLTDTHVDVRADVYEVNLAAAMKVADVRARLGKKWFPGSYNNLNRSFFANYARAKEESDVILLTGDLIDYGRGFWGINERDKLEWNHGYQRDRNWFLFHYLVAGGSSYSVPTYMVLGNHDWRLNPYPPFAIAGAPSPESIINNYEDFTSKELKELLQLAHGRGHQRAFSYETTAVGVMDLVDKNPDQALTTLGKLATNTGRLNIKGAPTETSIESVIWYLLAINPFLDYAFALPSGQKVLMLDWAEAEDVLFDIVENGRARPYLPHEVERASDAGPKAGDCLTDVQQKLVTLFVARPGTAKVVGIHAPPIGPYSDWYDSDLYAGRKTFSKTGAPRKHPERGPDIESRLPDGQKKRWNGHPFFAVKPPKAFDGMVADYGSPVCARDWFIRKLIEPGAGVRVVLAGHNHRDGVHIVWKMGKEMGPAWVGQLRVRGVPAPVQAVPAQSILGPVFVNTTSAGFRGHYRPRPGEGGELPPGRALLSLSSSGAVRGLEFRRLPGMDKRKPTAASSGTVTRERELAGAPGPG